MKKIILFSAILLLLMGLSALLATGFAFYWFSAPGPLKDKAIVLIEPGTGFNAIAQQLEQADVIGHALPFQAIVWWQGKAQDFKAGEYAFSPAISPRQVMEMLVKGESITHAVTIPEGWTTQEILTLLMADDRLSGAVPEGVSEGGLMPDTYYFHRGDDRQALINRMREAMQAALADAWARRLPELPLSNPQELLILASVIEEETGLPEERGRVAAVFVNRLKRGMKLQSDPTVIYGIEREDGPLGRALLRKDLERDHPYNTYRHAGLPQGPICHPGRASLMAAASPADTDELYFVATGDGGHYFATNLRDHNRNVARYRAVLRAQRE